MKNRKARIQALLKGIDAHTKLVAAIDAALGINGE